MRKLVLTLVAGCMSAAVAGAYAATGSPADSDKAGRMGPGTAAGQMGAADPSPGKSGASKGGSMGAGASAGAGGASAGAGGASAGAGGASASSAGGGGAAASSGMGDDTGKSKRSRRARASKG